MFSQPNQLDAQSFTIGAVPDVFTASQPFLNGGIKEEQSDLDPEAEDDKIPANSYRGIPGQPITIGENTTETYSYFAKPGSRVYTFSNSINSVMAYRRKEAAAHAEDERIKMEVFKLIPPDHQMKAVVKIYGGLVNLVNIIDKPSSRLRQPAQAVKSFLDHRVPEDILEEISFDSYVRTLNDPLRQLLICYIRSIWVSFNTRP